MKTFLFLLFSLFCQAGEIVSTKTPAYLGGGTKTTISNGQKSVTIKTQNGPKYLGGGSKSSIVKK